MDHTGKERHVPAGEGIGALKIQFCAFLHETLAVAPLVYSVFEMRVQDFHSCDSKVIRSGMHIEPGPTIGNENTPFGIHVVGQLQHTINQGLHQHPKG
jgi:hypothetical protein